MKAAVGLQRAVSLDAGVYPAPREALMMATLGGAHANGEGDRLGSPTPGKRADVVVFEHGIPRKSGGALTGVDVPRLVADAEAAAARLWG